MCCGNYEVTQIRVGSVDGETNADQVLPTSHREGRPGDTAETSVRSPIRDISDVPVAVPTQTPLICDWSPQESALAVCRLGMPRLIKTLAGRTADGATAFRVVRHRMR